MGRFFLKVFITISLLFIGVLAGIQIASERMISMKGYEDSTAKVAIDVKENKNGDVAASLLGNELNSTVKMKQLELQKMHAFNFVASVGNKVGEFSKNMTKKGLEFFSAVVDKVVP